MHTTLGEIAACCGMVAETSLTATFSGGCVTSVYGFASPPGVIECVAATLAGRRIACAGGLECVTAVVSTLP